MSLTLTLPTSHDPASLPFTDLDLGLAWMSLTPLPSALPSEKSSGERVDPADQEEEEQRTVEVMKDEEEGVGSSVAGEAVGG